MKHMMKKLLALTLILLFLVPETVLGETAVEEVSEASAAVSEKDGFHFDGKGFLTGENPAEEYIFEDEENGVWQYASRDLSVRVTRYEEKTKAKKKKVYCVAEIQASEASPLGAIQSDPKESLKFNGVAYPGIEQRVVSDLIEKHPSVLAVSDDMYGLRITPVGKGKTKYDYHGVIIRNGEVIATKTRNSQKRRNWPNMDTMAVYQDGSMKCYDCDALTAEEYLEQGAVHVFAFGPWLVSGGEIHPDLAKINDYSEPRAAIGMIEPYHYILIVTAGRPKEKYTGYKLTWLAEKMLEYGVTEALNLDGGDTVALAFNNKIILHGNMTAKKLRNLGSMIAFGIR